MITGRAAKQLRQLSILTLIGCTGCASIVGKTRQEVAIKSVPSGAKLEIIDVRSGAEVFSGTTPSIVMLDRSAGYFKKARYKVTIEKKGYPGKEILLEGSPNKWYLFGNIIFGAGAPIGYFLVDPATGAMWTLEPGDVNAELH